VHRKAGVALELWQVLQVKCVAEQIADVVVTAEVGVSSDGRCRNS
jgi:hypothetical protein